MATVKRFAWLVILGASSLVVWVLDAWQPEPAREGLDWLSIAPPVPVESDGYFTEFDG